MVLKLLKFIFYFIFIFKKFYLFIHEKHREEREREAETHAEGETGSMQGARPGMGDPGSPGSRKLLSHLGCPKLLKFK